MRNKFRIRRWLFGKHRRNPIVRFLAKQSEKNVSHYNNEDRNHIRNGEVWFQEQFLQFHKTKNTPPIVFDVGANIGEWSSNLLAKNNAAELHCFEPSEETFLTLSKTLSGFSHVQINQLGLSSSKQEIEFFENDGSDVTSLYRRFDAQNTKKISVKLITGDAYLAAHHINRIDFLKIDIEGMEYDALLGLRDTLASQKIQLVQFEYGEFNIHSERLLKHIYELLPDYTIGRLHPNYVDFMDWHHALENFKAANYIAILTENKALLRHFGK